MENWVIIDRLADVILNHCNGCIVEIGMGESTPILLKHAQVSRKSYFGCDTDKSKVRRLRRLSTKRDTVFCGTSIEFMEQFNDKPALVFIDGLHECETVVKETNFFLDRLAPNGVIFLHDTLPPSEEYTSPDYCGDVYKARHHFEKSKDVQCFTWPYTALQCGLTMIMKQPLCCADGY